MFLIVSLGSFRNQFSSRICLDKGFHMNEAHPIPIGTDPFYFSLGFTPVGSSSRSSPAFCLFSFFTRVSASSEEDPTIDFPKPKLSSPFPFPLSSHSCFVTPPSFSLSLHPSNQYYLIIDRMILLSARMARPAEHTFHFVNVFP